METLGICHTEWLWERYTPALAIMKAFPHEVIQEIVGNAVPAREHGDCTINNGALVLNETSCDSDGE